MTKQKQKPDNDVLGSLGLGAIDRGFDSICGLSRKSELTHGLDDECLEAINARGWM